MVLLLVGLGSLAIAGCFEDPPPPVDDGAQASSSSSASETPCDQGSVGCACFPNGTCDAGLVCNLGVCEPFYPTTTSMTSGSTTEMGTTDPSTTVADTSTSDPGTDDTSTGPGVSHVLFTTSQSFSGIEFGGLAGADDICTALGAELDDAWVAVLQEGGTSLQDRVNIEGEVVNVHGDLLATTADEFFSGVLSGIPGFDENGDEVDGSDLAWTGSETEDCSGWTSDDLKVMGTMGIPSTFDLWLDSTVPLPCSTPVRLYCISQ